MTMMKDILKNNPEAVALAGQQLLAIGKDLVGGKIDSVYNKAEVARQKYREWEELDRATADVEVAIRERERMVAVQHVVVDLVGTLVGAALRSQGV